MKTTKGLTSVPSPPAYHLFRTLPGKVLADGHVIGLHAGWLQKEIALFAWPRLRFLRGLEQNTETEETIGAFPLFPYTLRGRLGPSEFNGPHLAFLRFLWPPLELMGGSGRTQRRVKDPREIYGEPNEGQESQWKCNGV